VQEDGYDVVLITISISSSDEEIFRKVNATSRGGGGGLAPLRQNHQRVHPARGPRHSVVVVIENKHQDKYYSVCSDDFHGAYEGPITSSTWGHQRSPTSAATRFNLEALPGPATSVS
jgi:DNA-binding LacI/PurR family transcriptional regulator